MSFPTTSNRNGLAQGRGSAPEIRISVCLDCGTPIPAQLLELARTDLLLVADRPLRFGTAIQLAIFSDLISAVTQNRAVVHWCRPHSQGWQIGAFLSQPLPDRLTERIWNDLRASLRYDCNWKAWVLWDPSGQLESAKLLNYSIGGLRMFSTISADVGAEFTLFGSAGTRGRAVLNGQVQWCRPSEGGFQIGALIHGQRGRDLPRMFGNLEAVHAGEAIEDGTGPMESLETLQCALQLEERFMTSSRQHTPSLSAPADLPDRNQSPIRFG